MPARNARERSQIARIAALSRSATESGAERLAAANAAYRDSFNRGHECNVCKLVTIDQTLAADEITRRGDALYRRHMQALALKRDRNRRVAAELEAEAAAADQEWPALPARNEERPPNRYDVERAVEASDLEPIGRHILLVLCGRMMQGSTLIPREHSPSLTKLAAGTGWDRRTIMRYLNALEKAGWLIRHRPDPDKARKEHARTNYTVLMPGLGTASAQARDTGTPGARDKLSPG